MDHVVIRFLEGCKMIFIKKTGFWFLSKIFGSLTGPKPYSIIIVMFVHSYKKSIASKSTLHSLAGFRSI